MAILWCMVCGLALQATAQQVPLFQMLRSVKPNHPILPRRFARSPQGFRPDVMNVTAYQMPGMTGLEFMQLLNGKCKVILTTAFREYALEGFEHNVVGYLLKPIIFSRFYKAAQRAQEIISAPGKETDDYILVKTEYKGKLLRIKINDIIYIEGMGKYVRFHIRNADPVTALLTIAGLEEKLSRDRFVRIHKSFIIAIPFLSMINGNTVYLEFTKENLPIGQAYRDVFMGHMREKVITNTPGKPSTE